MKKVLFSLMFVIVFLFSGCTVFGETDEIVGQWVSESGKEYYVFLENGVVFKVYTNYQGEYCTAITVKDDTYETHRSWYREGETYYLKEFDYVNAMLVIDGDTISIDINNFYRIPTAEWIMPDEVFWSEAVTYDSHTLDELLTW